MLSENICLQKSPAWCRVTIYWHIAYCFIYPLSINTSNRLYVNKCTARMTYVHRIPHACRVTPAFYVDLPLLNLLVNELGENKLRMQDSIYHMALKSRFCIKTSRFCHNKTRRPYGRQRIILPGKCIFN